jgi:hypothetical protein
MRSIVITIAVLLFSSPAWAQSKPVCETFTDAEITDLLGTKATVKRPSPLGPEAGCLWGIMGLMFNVGRIQDDEPETLKGVVDSQLQNPRTGDIVKAEAGIGDAAVSTQGQYGRSVSLVFRSGKTAWTMSLEKVDQKLDVAAALPKLRVLAKKAVAAR